jgi:hypothetical protein
MNDYGVEIHQLEVIVPKAARVSPAILARLGLARPGGGP